MRLQGHTFKRLALVRPISANYSLEVISLDTLEPEAKSYVSIFVEVELLTNTYEIYVIYDICLYQACICSY